MWWGSHSPRPSEHVARTPLHFLLLTVQPGPGSDQRDLIFSQGVGKAEAEGVGRMVARLVCLSEPHSEMREILVLLIVP